MGIGKNVLIFIFVFCICGDVFSIIDNIFVIYGKNKVDVWCFDLFNGFV